MHEKIYVSCTHPENETGHDKSGHDQSAQMSTWKNSKFGLGLEPTLAADAEGLQPTVLLLC